MAEDNATVLGLLETVLAAEGYEIIQAVDGREAESLWWEQRDRIDAAVLDHQMPHATGRDVAAAITAAAPDVPVVILSAQIIPSLAAELDQTGLVWYDKQDIRPMLDHLADELGRASSRVAG